MLSLAHKAKASQASILAPAVRSIASTSSCAAPPSAKGNNRRAAAQPSKSASGYVDVPLTPEQQAIKAQIDALKASQDKEAATPEPWVDSRWRTREEYKDLRWGIRRDFKQLGSEQTDLEWHPDHSPYKPKSAFEVSVSHLVASGCHLGHHPALTESAYHPYLAGRREGIDIINVEHTLPSLRKACAVVRDILRDDGVIVFVGRKRIFKLPILKAVERLGANAHGVTTRWKPGTLTNAAVMFGPEIVLSGAHLPDLVVVLDPKNSAHVIRECNLSTVPTMAITDTDIDPRMVTFPIYSNNASARAIELIVGALARAGEEGIQSRVKRLDPVTGHLLPPRQQELIAPGGQYPLHPGDYQARPNDMRDFKRVEREEQGEDARTWVGPKERTLQRPHRAETKIRFSQMFVM